MVERRLGDLIDLTRSVSAELAGTLVGRSGVDVGVSSVEHDSRRVQRGALFCAVPGLRHDGHDHAPSAVDRGATALLVERDVDVDVAQVRVLSVRASMPWYASHLYDRPSSRVPVAGVTGTNGKTTITQLLATIVANAGGQATVIGTLGGVHTTPEAPKLQAQLAVAADDGADLVALEVSSHALDQHRVDGVEFAVALFTNLTRDHLDYHQTMDEYFAAKARLFDGRARQAVINVDDPYGERLAGSVPDAVRYSIDAVQVDRADRAGTRFRWRGEAIELALAGRFNVSNAIGAAEAALTLGYSEATIAAGLSAVTIVRGRMQLVDSGPDDPTVLVDYSHTPDGLEKVLATAREFGGGRVIVVFGCGGDRDATKRPMMGRAAALGSDLAIVTSDNPRSEDPMAIIGDALAGIEDRRHVIIEVDRRQAIAIALHEAERADVVVIAGKGHETTQTIGDDVLPFDDVEIARELMATGRGDAS